MSLLMDKVKEPKQKGIFQWKAWGQKPLPKQAAEVAVEPVVEPLNTGGVVPFPLVEIPTVWFTKIEKPVTKWGIEAPSGQKVPMTFPDEMAHFKFLDGIPKVTPIKVGGEGLLSSFIAASVAVIEEAGVDHTYEPWAPMGSVGMTARYTKGEFGDCLIGKVLVKMGVPASALKVYEGVTAEAVIARLFDGPQVRETGRLASQMQRTNDLLRPWGEALTLAQHTKVSA